MERYFFWIILPCLVCFSIQQNIRLSSSSTSEGELVTLRCIATLGHDSFELSLNNEIVVQSTRTNYTLAQGKNESQYVVSVKQNDAGKYVLRLEFSPVSRYDTGRWQCLVSSTSGSPPPAEIRTNLDVNYFPDPEYPTCQITSSKRAVCTTQEGRPIVTLRWTQGAQGSVDDIPERGSISSKSDSIVLSELQPSALSPPETYSDAIFCNIERNSKSRQCRILKQDIYDLASLNISQVNGEETVRCSVDPSYLTNSLVLSWDNSDQLQGHVSSADNNKGVNFGEVTSNLDGTKVVCTLAWGAFDYKNISLALVVNVPPTTANYVPTTVASNMSPSKPVPLSDDVATKRPVDKDDKVKTVEPAPRDVIIETTKRMSRDKISTTEVEPIFTSVEETTELSYEFETAESGQKVLLIALLSALILAIFILLCIICICVLCKRKKRATATVI